MVLRVDEQETPGASDKPPLTQAEQRRAKKLTFKEIQSAAYQASSTFNRIPVLWRAPAVDIPFENPLPHELFLLFITREQLQRIAVHTNKSHYN